MYGFTKSVKFVSLVDNQKLAAVKQIKETLNKDLKESLDFLNYYLGSDKEIIIELSWNQCADLREYINIVVVWDEDDNDDEVIKALSATELESLDWYKNQDALTKVMIDNYITAIGYGPKVYACGG
jgi:hypothetical protein